MEGITLVKYKQGKRIERELLTGGLDILFDEDFFYNIDANFRETKFYLTIN